jgi:hypothetical protein
LADYESHIILVKCGSFGGISVAMLTLKCFSTILEAINYQLLKKPGIKISRVVSGTK